MTTTDELEARITGLEDEISAYEDQVEALTGERDDLKSAHDLLEEKVAAATSLAEDLLRGLSR